MTDRPTPESDAKQKLRDRILEERKAGNIVFWGLPGKLMTAKLDEFVEQPAEGMLYDLNRLEEISLTFLDDPKWVNDFAVALTIRKLKADRDALREQMKMIENDTIERCAKVCEDLEQLYKPEGFPMTEERKALTFEYCASCGGSLDTGWECNKCGRDWRSFAYPWWERLWHRVYAASWGKRHD